MAFCANCGQELPIEANYCNKCGAPVVQETTNRNTRKDEYEGKVYKCPRCGEPIKSFQTTCSFCGHELRESHVSSVVTKFVEKLEKIQDEPDPIEKENKKQDSDELSKKDKKLIAFIKRFPIPNTKEDLFEFLILTSSNANLFVQGDTSESEDAISDAWEAKYYQAYQKAKISFGDSPEFIEIDREYQSRLEKREKKKRMAKIGWTLLAIGIVLVTAFIYFLAYKSITKNDQEEAAENTRLELILGEVTDFIAEGNYPAAKAKASQLVFSASGSITIREHWDEVRTEMYQIIDDAEEQILTDNGETNNEDFK